MTDNDNQQKDEQQKQADKNNQSLEAQFNKAFDKENLSDKEKAELETILAKVRQEIGDEINHAKLKVRVVNVNQVQTMYKRLGKVSNFHYVGAVLCLVAGLYFVQQGKQILPALFGFIMLVNVVMSLLSYRATIRIERFMQGVQQQAKRKFKK